MASFYIATGLERAPIHTLVRDKLVALGHTLTYDWTVHGNVKHTSKERLNQVADIELSAVIEADVVIVLLPGGFGTHTELGAALSLGKEVFIHSNDPEVFEPCDKTCAFYHHSRATQVVCSLDAMNELVDTVQRSLSPELV